MQRMRGEMFDAMNMLSNLYLMAAEKDSNNKESRSDALRAIRKLEDSGRYMYKVSRHAEALSQESQEY